LQLKEIIISEVGTILDGGWDCH